MDLILSMFRLFFLLFSFLLILNFIATLENLISQAVIVLCLLVMTFASDKPNISLRELAFAKLVVQSPLLCGLLLYLAS